MKQQPQIWHGTRNRDPFRHRTCGPRSVAMLWLVLALLLLLSTWTTRAGVGSFRFAWLSDTHIGSGTAEADLRAAVRDINSSTGLSFVIISGDVTEYGSRDQLRLAKEVLQGLTIPYYVLPGNHDCKWSESGATDFHRIFGNDRFMFEHEGVRFIGMHQGPLMRMGDGHWAPQDVRWLEQTLRDMPDTNQPLFFVTHYPIDPGIANWYVVLDLLKTRNTQVVLCGHGHSNRKLTFEGVPGIMGRSSLRAKAVAGAFNIVQVDSGSLTVSEHITGAQTKPPWHALALKTQDFDADTNTYPRPDFSVNSSFPNVKEGWRFSTGQTVAASPAVADDLVIVGDASGAVHALSLQAGQRLWQYQLGAGVFAAPAVAGHRVILTSADGRVYALGTRAGNKLWEFAGTRPIVAAPLVHKGTVYVGSSEGKFRALDAANGQLKWEYDGIKGFVETRPLLYRGKVIFGAWDEHLYALEAHTGKLAWMWKGDRRGVLLSPAACWPVGAAGKVFFAAPDRMLTAVDISTGRQVWRTGDYVVRESIGISENGSRFYVRAMNDMFYAFSTSGEKPEKVWETNAQFGYDINSAALVENEGTVFYGTKNGLLFALEGKTGAIVWRHKMGVGLVNTVVPLGNRRLLAADVDGKVVLLQWQQKQPIAGSTK